MRTIYPGAQGWDQELLALELQGLIDLKFEVELTGFSLAEIDLVRGCPSSATKKLRPQATERAPTA